MPTVTVPLTQGKFAIIDAEDWPLVGQFKWYARRDGPRWYAQRGDNRSSVHLHRFILDAPDELSVDHINGDGLDNRRENLRLATQSQNHANTPARKDNRLGLKGVSRRSARSYAAEVARGGQRYYLGRFRTAEAAARAYDAKARELFGPFAHCNFPEQE